jgi:hypothetical protein
VANDLHLIAPKHAAKDLCPKAAHVDSKASEPMHGCGMKGRYWGATQTLVHFLEKNGQRRYAIMKETVVVMTPSPSLFCDDPKIIVLADALARLNRQLPVKSESGDSKSEKEKYQLQLRMPESRFRQIEALVERAGAETVSETVRMALRELERAIRAGVSVVFEDGRSISRNPNGVSTAKNLRTQDSHDEVFVRVNVVLGNKASAGLKYIQSAAEGFTLGEIVDAAVAVLDESLLEEERLSVEIGKDTSLQGPVTHRRSRK